MPNPSADQFQWPRPVMKAERTCRWLHGGGHWFRSIAAGQKTARGLRFRRLSQAMGLGRTARDRAVGLPSAVQGEAWISDLASLRRAGPHATRCRKAFTTIDGVDAPNSAPERPSQWVSRNMQARCTRACGARSVDEVRRWQPVVTTAEKRGIRPIKSATRISKLESGSYPIFNPCAL